jgi:hypothetical protein
MLHDEMEEMRERGYEMTADGIWMGRDQLTEDDSSDWMGVDAREVLRQVLLSEEVVVTETAKDANFWKYSEGKILREIESYLSGTYNGHYVADGSRIQTLDLIDSIGDSEAFCRSNAIKYLSRFGKKNGKNRQDILKVIHYAILLYHFADLPFSEDAVETHSPTGR